MGQELGTSQFGDEDFVQFTDKMRAETELLSGWEAAGEMSGDPTTIGFELEAWLVDEGGRPAAENEAFIDAVDNELVVPELSLFNVEFNGNPAELTGRGLQDLHIELEGLWKHAVDRANSMGLKLANIGILPTVESADLCIDNMSKGNRYKALNEQVFRLRKGKPIKLNIEGKETLRDEHHDVMLEAAATSFQIHIKVPPGGGVNYYNASKLASAPLIAVSANSPFLFGKNLWAETRIPLFEQAVSVGDWDYAERVTFGVRFIEESLSEVFAANRQRYPILLPEVRDAAPEKMAHLRLQNGTIWRWNRPLVGWDDDGTPHFRMEQRVVPAGPTIADSIANSAFYYGLVTYLADHETPPHERTQFFTTRDNFYACAKHGLEANVRWDHIDEQPIDQLILEAFLPMAKEGLKSRQVADEDVEKYLGIIEARCRSGHTGAAWQRAYVSAHSASLEDMLEAYIKNQETGKPVHEWTL